MHWKRLAFEDVSPTPSCLAGHVLGAVLCAAGGAGYPAVSSGPKIGNGARAVGQHQIGSSSNPTAFERAHVKFADPVELRLYEDRCASAAHAHAAFDETQTLQAVWRLYAALWEATLDSEDSTFRSNVARTAHDLSECQEVRQRSPPSRKQRVG